MNSFVAHAVRKAATTVCKICGLLLVVCVCSQLQGMDRVETNLTAAYSSGRCNDEGCLLTHPSVGGDWWLRPQLF